MKYRDPSGLAPEKEKHKDEVMDALELNQEIVEDPHAWMMLRGWEGDWRPLFEEWVADWIAKVEEIIALSNASIGNRSGSSGSTENGLGGEDGLTDGTGKKVGAWEITNEWTDEMIDKYHTFASKQSEMYHEMGAEFTCEDFSLQILIDFASENGLPLSIETGSGTFDAADPQWGGDTQSFTNALLSAAGANDLISFGNTVPVSMDNLKSGDLMIERKNGTTANHVQVVNFTTNTSIYVLQGQAGALSGIPGSSRILGASDPSSRFYTGKAIETGRYERGNGNYFNYSNNGFEKNWINSRNVIGARWNFKKW